MNDTAKRVGEAVIVATLIKAGEKIVEAVDERLKKRREKKDNDK